MNRNMRISLAAVCLLLVGATVLSYVSCSFLPAIPNGTDTETSAPPEANRRLLTDKLGQKWDGDSAEAPVSTPEKDNGGLPTETSAGSGQPGEPEDALILSLIYANIAYDLSLEGFTCFFGSLMFLHENDNRLYDGMLYTDFSRSEALSMPNEPVLQGGFVTVSENDSRCVPLWDLITYGAFGLTDDLNYPLEIVFSSFATFDGSFVANGKYIVYTWDSPVHVSYRTYDSVPGAYPEELGAIYDYDKKTYVVDPVNGSAVSPVAALYENRDFVTLQEALNDLLDSQDEQGMTVEQLTYLYIDPAATAAFAASGESFESFFGFAPEELLEVFGEGTALVITPDGQITPGILLEMPPASDGDGEGRRYDWEGLFRKIVSGCAIILIGAALTAATGGTFTCALAAIVTNTLISTAVEEAAVFLIDTARNVIDGTDLGTAMKTAARDTADRLGNIFLANSVAFSLHALKTPTAVCFPADTLVLMANGNGKRIADVRQGDAVRAYDPTTGNFITAVVTNVTSRLSTSSVRIITPFGEAEATATHPFFSVKRNTFIRADELLPEYDTLLGADGESIPILSAETSETDERLVFTLEIDGAHTFAICGSGSAFYIVHNACGDSQKLKRNMIKAGMKTPVDYRYAAHHMIPTSDNRYPECELLRGYLKEFKVDKNSPANGVFLSTERSCLQTVYHADLHTEAYYKWVLETVRDAQNRSQFICRLSVVRVALLLLIK